MKNKNAWYAPCAALLLSLSSYPSHATLIGFEGLTGGAGSFTSLGIQNTYFGHTWTAANSAQSPTDWGVSALAFGEVSALSGSSYAYTFNGGQSMFIDFSSPQNVIGVWAAAQFPDSAAASLQLFGYDSGANLIGQSSVLNLVVGQWQLLGGAALDSLAVSRLEIRSNAPTTWYALDDLEIRRAGEGQVSSPTTVALVGLGLAGLGWSGRGKSRVNGSGLLNR